MPRIAAQPTENVEAPTRLRWTRAVCEGLVAQGLLVPGKYELIDGQILTRMGQKRPHTAAVALLFGWCVSVFGVRFVQTQGSIDVAPEDTPTNEPEPDVFVLRRPIDDFPVDYPGPSDLALVAEVSDATLAFDLSTKASLYARAGILEYWVVDIPGRALVVHREPSGDRYGWVARYQDDESVATFARPEAVVPVAELLPPVA